jgi:3-isopropylmalate dehydrogenase
VHGSAPDIVGQQKANPLAAILTVGLMLEQLGHPSLQQEIQDAVTWCLRSDYVTPELGGSLTTTEVTSRLLERLVP